MVDIVTIWQGADGRALGDAVERGAVVPIVIGPAGKPTIYFVDELSEAVRPGSVYFVGPARVQYVVDNDGAVFPVESGSGGGITPFEYVQSSPSASWIVNHNFTRYPVAVTVLSVGNVEVEAAITHVSVNQLIVSFALPYVGRVLVI